MPRMSYTKFYRFKAVSPSTLTEEDSSGYGAITIAMDGNDIKITSSAEFSSECFLDDNQGQSARWVSASEIRWTPYPLTNWGTMIGEIVEK